MENKGLQILSSLYKNEFGSIPCISPLKGGGSSRKYFRLSNDAGDPDVIGVLNSNVIENNTFISLDRVFERAGINVPHIISVADNLECYLLQDLGDRTLLESFNGQNKIEYAEKALDELIKVQSMPVEIWEKYVFSTPFSERLVMWDLNYFKYDYLKVSGIEFDEELLENDFEHIVADISRYPKELESFMYRDFQSRNIMVKNGELWLIDFQGGRKGPIVYDMVSFLWQAKSPFDFNEKERLANYYCEKTAFQRKIDVSEIKGLELPMALFRTLQVLGAYGLRGLIERKQHFIESIPYALKNLRYLKERGAVERYPELSRIIDRLDGKNRDIHAVEKSDKVNDKLTLSVFSFSYKKGYPDDNSGNGGGFMFDCRGMHNPGRYEEYKDKTGLDSEVISFLEEKGECVPFVEKVANMVSPTIERYMKRGFTSLQVGFGCTGGQHRSVYCAEYFARMMASKYPEIRIKVVHREQKIQKDYL